MLTAPHQITDVSKICNNNENTRSIYPFEKIKEKKRFYLLTLVIRTNTTSINNPKGFPVLFFP